VVKSPIDGTVVEVHRRPGQSVRRCGRGRWSSLLFIRRVISAPAASVVWRRERRAGTERFRRSRR
jgi:hypothetical protein